MDLMFCLCICACIYMIFCMCVHVPVSYMMPCTILYLILYEIWKFGRADRIQERLATKIWWGRFYRKLREKKKPNLKDWKFIIVLKKENLKYGNGTIYHDSLKNYIIANENRYMCLGSLVLFDNPGFRQIFLKSPVP